MNRLIPQPLPSLLLGEKRVRFLYLMGDGVADLQVSPDGHGIHLFLAADVLADSSIIKENQPRLHARFAKKGLATKVNFQPNLKLEGIHGIAKGIWFYSIQGVFRIVFEFLDRAKQLDCLNSLTGLWQSNFHDPLLSPSITVHMQLSLPSTHAPFEMHESVRQIQECGENSQIRNTAGVERTKTSPDLANSEEFHETAVLSREQECLQAQLQVDVAKMVSDSTLNLGSVVSVRTVSQSSTDAALSSETDHPFIALTTYLQDLEENCDNGDHQVQLFQLLQRLVKDYYKPDQKSFPLDLLFDFALQSSISDIHTNDDWPDEHQFALCIISKWLGKQFHKYGPTIATHVEDFKSKNIDHIDNLPPAGELVCSLFPPAMCCLLENWMGINEAQAGAAKIIDTHNDSEASKVKEVLQNCKSRTGEPRSKVKRQTSSPRDVDNESESRTEPEQATHLYPLMQIILEFTNQTLISGVAHVLYTRLIH